MFTLIELPYGMEALEPVISRACTEGAEAAVDFRCMGACLLSGLSESSS